MNCFRCFSLTKRNACCSLAIFISAILFSVTANGQQTRRSKAISSSQVAIKSALIVVADSVEVPVEQAGVLTELKVKPGQLIRAGELIAKVKDESLLLKLEKARHEHELAKMAASSNVDVEYSQKSYEVAAAELRRSNESNSRVQNSIPVSRVEKQQLEKDRTALKLQQSKRELTMAAYRTRITSNEISLAKSDLQKTSVVAPMGGLVVAVNKRVGEWVESSNTICKIIRTDRLQIEGFLVAKDARLIRIGTSAKMRFEQDWVEPKEVACEIVFISPEANPINGKLMVRAEFDNQIAKVPAGLKADIIIDVIH